MLVRTGKHLFKVLLRFLFFSPFLSSWLLVGLQHQLCHVFCHRVCGHVHQLHRNHGWSQHVRWKFVGGDSATSDIFKYFPFSWTFTSFWLFERHFRGRYCSFYQNLVVDLKAGLSLPVIVSYIILRYRNTQKISDCFLKVSSWCIMHCAEVLSHPSFLYILWGKNLNAWSNLLKSAKIHENMRGKDKDRV